MAVLRLLLALAGVLTIGCASAAPLPEVVRDVLERHPDVRSARALLAVSDELVRQARSNYYPTLGLTWNRAESRNEQLGTLLDRSRRRSEAVLSWNVFRGATDVYRSRSARESRGAADLDLASARESVARQIAERYIEVLNLRAQLGFSQALVDDYRRLSEQVRTRTEAGRLSRADLAQIQVDLIGVETRHAALRAQLEGAEYRYRRMTGLEPDSLIPPGFEGLNWASEALLAAAEAANPQLRAALKRVNARRADIGAARGALMPSVDLELRKRLGARIDPAEVSDTLESSQVAVTLEVPLGGGSLSRVSEAAQRLEAARAEADAIRLQLDSELAPLAAELHQLRDIEPQLAARVVASHRLVNAYALQFEAGRRSLSDLAGAHAERFNAQTALVDNHLTMFTVEARLLSLAGGLQDGLAHAYRTDVLPEVEEPPAPPVEALFPVAADPAVTLTRTGAGPAFDAAAQVAGWSGDWSAGDFSRYRSHYLADFHTAKLDTEAWEAGRRARVSRAGIVVDVDRLEQFELPDGRVVTRFVQHYRSPGYEDTVVKRLVWVVRDGRWQIAEESVE